MDDNGWVKTHRSVFSHHLFDGQEFSEREAWLWLIAKAAWKDTPQRKSAETVIVERGTLSVSMRQLQTAWGWQSVKRVFSFLKMLEKNGMIGNNTETGKSLITICNYDVYQSEEPKQETSKKHVGNTKEEAKNIIINKTLPSGVYAHPREADLTVCESFAVEEAPEAPELPLPQPALSPQAPALNFGEQQPQAVSAPQAQPKAKTRRPKSEKTPLPEGFGISDAVRKWAEAKGHTNLETHLEAFVDKALAKGYTNLDWDSAFKTAIREDWAGLNKPKNFGKPNNNYIKSNKSPLFWNKEIKESMDDTFRRLANADPDDEWLQRELIAGRA